MKMRKKSFQTQSQANFKGANNAERDSIISLTLLFVSCLKSTVHSLGHKKRTRSWEANKKYVKLLA